MKTQDQIAERINSIAKDALLFRFDLLFPYLDFAHSKEYIKDGVTEEQWLETQAPLDKDSVIAEMKRYMSFAKGKAENGRGISAYRSLAYYQEWLWLIDEDKLSEYTQKELDPYGVQQLQAICEYFKWDYNNLEAEA